MINLRQAYQALNGYRVGDFSGYGDVNPLMAQIDPAFVPSWYALQIHPAHERIAAGHLIGRRFGVFLPEVPGVALVRGKRRRVLNPMFPGYLFLFTWLSPANYHRARSCPGVWDFLCLKAEPAVIADAAIDAVRAVENKQRPLTMTQEGIGMMRKVKRRWRRNSKTTEQPITDNEIISVHTWSALRDGLQQNLDSDKRTQLLFQALGLA